MTHLVITTQWTKSGKNTDNLCLSMNIYWIYLFPSNSK